MTEIAIRWENVIVRTSDKNVIATLYRNASIGWEIPMKGDVIVIDNIRWTVVAREYIPAEETWVLEVV